MANVKEVEVIVIRDLTDNMDFELEENVEVALADFVVDAKDLNIIIMDGV